MNPEEPKQVDNMPFGRSDAPEIRLDRLGVSNRQADEDVDSDIDAEPGEPQTEDINE